MAGRQLGIASFFKGGNAAVTFVPAGDSSGRNPSRPKKRKYDRDCHRSLTEEHKRAFPWLVLQESAADTDDIESQPMLLLCSWCKDAGRRNIFTIGKVSNKPKKDDFVKHEKTNERTENISDRFPDSDNPINIS